MNKKFLKLIGIILAIILIIGLIITICLVFKVEFEKENKGSNSEYDINIINSNSTIKQDVESELLKSDFLGENMQVSGVVNFINDQHIFVRGNATSELDSRVETEFGVLEAANIYIDDTTKIIDYITGKEISVNDIKVKDIVIVEGDVYENIIMKIVDARGGIVKRLQESDYEEMQQATNNENQ